VGTDGGLIAAPVEVDELLVAPGQRYDIFVRGRAAGGSLRLLNLPYDRFGSMSGGMGVTTNNRTETLATLEYTGVAEEPGFFLIVWPTPA
jgi:FtsP/CotA-like multicopper oxidase with cupredoxin domain